MEEILRQAGRLENVYDWLGAAEFYEKALKLMPENDFSRKSEACERLGYAFCRAAFQAENSDEFRQRLNQAIHSYKRTEEICQKLNGPTKTGKILRCDAMIAYVGYWLASEAPEKKRLANDCWRLAKESLKAFEEAGDAREYGRTYGQLSMSIDLGFSFKEDWQAREEMLKEAIEYGERTIKFLSTLEDPYELARAYVKTATYLELFGYYLIDLDERERCFQKAMSNWQKATELSDETAMLELSSVLFGTGPAGYWGNGTDNALSNFRKALECAAKTKDKFIIGRVLDLLTYHTSWRALATEDPDEKVELAKETLRYAEDAKHQYSPISFISPRGGVFWVEARYAEHYWQLARYEADVNERRELLRKAMQATPELLELAEDSGYVEIIGLMHLTLGCLLRDLARIEPNPEEKKGLCERALVEGNVVVRINEQIEPTSYWNRGLMYGFKAQIKSLVADLVKDSETKKAVFQEAILDSENSLKLCIKGAESYEKETSGPLFHTIGSWQLINGSLFSRLYELTNDRQHLRKAAEAFKDAVESFQELNLVSRIAECYWKAAQTYYTLGDHLKAAQNFHLASDNYRSAAEKIPQLKSFYKDHAVYMQAWTEIEKARHHHERQEYGLAKEHFEKAANLHNSLKKWSYLAPNYSAWANVEHAEDLSRKEQCEEAVKAFEQALKLFNETKKSIQHELNKITDLDEKRMATSMVKATDMRHEYCVARIALEEARILDKKGDHYFSSEKYGQAAETFEEVSQALETDGERREFDFIISLSRAWQKTTQAEAETSPKLYDEASRLFEKAREFSPNEQAKMLVLGHSRFCKALEEGTKFADTRDANMHATATKYLESAANYYVSAGFQKASEYAKATQLLFDAYAQMDNAKRESDPEKKARLYMMTEKVLQTSAGSFMKAEHPEKRERVLRLLSKVEEERELAISLIEVLHAPSIVSSTAVFTTPPPTHEEAVGSERFEHADIQTNLRVRQKELKIGESLKLEIELVNAGKGPALLTKITEVIPEGFELTEKPDMYRIEDSYLNMKGKRLDPLKTEEVKLVLKPTVQGTFSLKPTVLYLDENGKYKSHEPEPILIVVRELGIKGWLKGER